MLTSRVVTALVPLRTHFSGLQGRAFELVTKGIKAETDTVNKILTSPGVAQAFGFPAAGRGWPLENPDPNGAKLIEAAGKLLPANSAYRIGYTRFILLQQAARAGQQALDAVLEPNDPKDDIEKIVKAGYNWASTLREYQNAA